jgi:hypothetical protein
MTTSAQEQLRLIEPISLDDLIAQAALQTRVDRKYVVRIAAVEVLLEQLPAGTRMLEIDGRRRFGYRSTYLDTPGRESFLGAGRSGRRRWKVRTRAYLDTGTTWLEVKTRGPRAATVKHRTQHPEVDATAGLTASGRAFVAGRLGPQVAAALEPTLVTAYRRSTLLLPASRSRVTIDVELAWTSVGPEGELHRPSLAIIETKTGATPSEVDRLLWSHGVRPVRISKYGVGMAALHPDLPRLKWHRTLHQQLGVGRVA